MLLTIKQINARAKALGTKQSKINDEVHILLCHTVIHAKEHGDVTCYDAITKAMRGADRTAITRWVHDFGLARLDNDGAFKVNKKARDEFAGTLEELIEGTKWYDYVPEMREVSAAFDFEARVASLLAQLDKITQDGKRQVKGAEAASYIRAAMIKFHADQMGLTE